MKWQLRLCFQLWIGFLACFFMVSPVLAVGKSNVVCCDMKVAKKCCCAHVHHRKDKPLSSSSEKQGCGKQQCLIISGVHAINGLESTFCVDIPQPKFLFETKSNLILVDTRILHGSQVSVWQPPRF